MATLEILLPNLAPYGHWAAVLGLVFARVFPVVLLAPFLGGGLPSIPLKSGLALALAVLIAPSYQSAVSPPQNGLIAPLLVWQVAIGLLIGVTSRLPFQIQEMAGELIEFLAGLRNDEILAPQFGGRMTILGTLQSQAALITFFAFNGHLIVVGALATSVQDVPVTEVPALSAGVGPVCESIATITGMALGTAVSLAAPVLLAVLIAQLAIGALSKVLRASSFYEDAPPVKLLVAGIGVMASAGVIVSLGWRFALNIVGSLGSLVHQVK